MAVSISTAAHAVAWVSDRTGFGNVSSRFANGKRSGNETGSTWAPVFPEESACNTLRPKTTLLVGGANDKSNACRARAAPRFIVRCISA